MNAIATPEQLFNFIGIDNEGVSAGQRDRAQLILDGVASEICKFTGMKFTRATEDVIKLDGTGTSIMVIDEQPVHNVESLFEGATELDPDSYEWGQDGRLRRFCGVWCNRLRYYSATVDHGWDEVPADVKLICLRVTARGWANPTGLAQESAGGWSGGYGFDSSRFVALTDTDRDQLKQWMNR